MTPNPSLRPFIVGAVLFLAVLAGWPSSASRGDREPAPQVVAELGR